MTLKEIIKKYKTPVRVKCSQIGYPPFTIIESSEETAKVQYDDGHYGIVDLEIPLDDYEVC